jgi:16S rRNA C1402 N4-methylase RsmH
MKYFKKLINFSSDPSRRTFCNEKPRHIPVMVRESLKYLVKKDDGLYLDATFGEGGHSKEILTRYANVTLFSIDRDPEVIPRANELKSIYNSRFNFVKAKHGYVSRIFTRSYWRCIV